MKTIYVTIIEGIPSQMKTNNDATIAQIDALTLKDPENYSVIEEDTGDGFKTYQFTEGYLNLKVFEKKEDGENEGSKG
jgi:hypothetical protein